jgi:hypothetical protein
VSTNKTRAKAIADASSTYTDFGLRDYVIGLLEGQPDSYFGTDDSVAVAPASFADVPEAASPEMVPSGPYGFLKPAVPGSNAYGLSDETVAFINDPENMIEKGPTDEEVIAQFKNIADQAERNSKMGDNALRNHEQGQIDRAYEAKITQSMREDGKTREQAEAYHTKPTIKSTQPLVDAVRAQLGAEPTDQ